MTDIIVTDYILYIKGCPGVKIHNDFKIGICNLSLSRLRLATYQNCVGPVWEEQFLKVYLGDENHIRKAEATFKQRFKNQIKSHEAGYSEWISGIKLDELLDFINVLRDTEKGYSIKFIDAPDDFVPLTMPLCEGLALWYKDYLEKLI